MSLLTHYKNLHKFAFFCYLGGSKSSSSTSTSSKTTHNITQTTRTTNITNSPEQLSELIDATSDFLDTGTAFLGETFATALNFVSKEQQNTLEAAATLLDKDLNLSNNDAITFDNGMNKFFTEGGKQIALTIGIGAGLFLLYKLTVGKNS